MEDVIFWHTHMYTHIHTHAVSSIFRLSLPFSKKEREEWETTERKKWPRDLPEFKPGTFRLPGECSSDWATSHGPWWMEFESDFVNRLLSPSLTSHLLPYTLHARFGNFYLEERKRRVRNYRIRLISVSVSVLWGIRLTRLTLVCEVIRYRLVQVRQNLKKKDFSGWRPAITILYLFLFHSLLRLTSFFSQYKSFSDTQTHTNAHTHVQMYTARHLKGWQHVHFSKKDIHFVRAKWRLVHSLATW